jgi:hypothetical protein
MMTHRRLGLALTFLAIALLACAGNGVREEIQPPEPLVQPSRPLVQPTAGLDRAAEPNFESVDLESGFLPDPHETELVSGGGVDAAELGLGSGCASFATRAPDVRLNWSGESVAIRIFFVAEKEGEDATLIVSDAEGNWHCNDDYAGRNPLLEIENPPQGQTAIWVGSFSSDEFIGGTLYITEQDLGPEDYAGEHPSGNGGQLDYSLQPNFGEVDLESGFAPDPYDVALISGGSIGIEALGLGDGCTGYATSAPDFRIHWSGLSAELRVFFVPDEAGDDVTLVVNTATAGWACNDDYSGFDPLVALKEPAAGQYDIWIGSRMAGEFIVGTLYITEMSYGPDHLP